MVFLPALVLCFPSGAMRLSWPPPLNWVWSQQRPKGWQPAPPIGDPPPDDDDDDDDDPDPDDYA